MKHNLLLTVASSISILLFTFHFADDIARGFEPGGVKNIMGVLIVVVWLYATPVLTGRRSGYIIILLGSLGGSGIPVVHRMGAGLVGDVANSSGIFFWVWTLIALQVTAILSLILSAGGLWSLRRRKSARSGTKI